MKEKNIQVIKRDGRIVEFDKARIENAIKKAMARTGVDDYGLIKNIANTIEFDVANNAEISVEEIQDYCEDLLMQSERKDVAKEYIRYRYKRSEERHHQDKMFSFGSSILDSSNEEVIKENANLNGESFSGKMNKFGSEYSKEFAKKFIVPEYIMKYMDEGWTYINDLDTYALGQTNCIYLPLDKLLGEGFQVGSKGNVRTPSNISSAMAQVAVIFQCQQNAQFGGVGAAKFDYSLAPYVKKSFAKHFKKGQTYFHEERCVDDNVHITVSNKVLEKCCPKSYEYAKKETINETYQAAESLVHNLNTMASRAGGQVAFSSITFGLDISFEGRLVVEALLQAQINGLGNGQTSIFPQTIYQCLEGVNQSETDPNYDLFLKAVECSSKRLFPNFVNVDATFNYKHYDRSDPDTAIATMGCVDGSEVITYKIDDKLYVESFKRMYHRLGESCLKMQSGISEYMEHKNLKIYDSSINDFTKVKKIIRNPDQGNWTLVKLNNGRSLLATSDHPLPVLNKGRTFIKDLKNGDQIPIAFNQYVEENEIYSNEKSWLNGLILCDSSYSSGILRVSLGNDERDVCDYARKILKSSYNTDSKVIEQNRGFKGSYLDVVTTSSKKEFLESLYALFGGWNKVDRKIPNYVFNSNRESRLSFLAGMIDADGHVKNVRGAARIEVGSTNKELAIQQAMLAQSLGIKSKIYLNKYSSKDTNKIRYKVEFYNSFELNKYIKSKKKNSVLTTYPREANVIVSDYAKVTEINSLGYINEFSYDVETESDTFDVSGINSHNCRTRSIEDRHSDKPYQSGKGNLSFCTINLPKLGIEYGLHKNKESDIDGFWNRLDEVLGITLKALVHRYEIQCNQLAKTSDFMMQNGVWKDGDKIDPNDKVKDLLKHGSLSIGFCGLAECLKALFGKHHGEDEDVWKFGYHLIKYMRDYTNRQSDELDMNIGLFASPAESTAGKFAKMNQKQYGIIEGVTDRDYITNSYHIPVYFNIESFKKIDLEAPFHELCNAGHISYIELDGSARNNQVAFKQIVQYAFKKNMGYFSVNHPIDRCACGYEGIIGTECPSCGEANEENFYRLRRITGYLSSDLRNFNAGKKAEEKDRVKHKTLLTDLSC